MRWRRVLLAVAPVFLLAPGTAAADFRCDGQLVGKGDHKVVVRRHCGEPDFVDGPRGGLHYRHWYLPAEEEWYYNLGNQRLIRILSFRNGRLRHIETDGYGFSESHPGECSGTALRRGLSKFELYARCGEPLSRDTHVRVRPIHHERKGKIHRPRERTRRARPVLVDEWVYDLGPGRFLRHVFLAHGVVVRVESGERSE